MGRSNVVCKLVPLKIVQPWQKVESSKLCLYTACPHYDLHSGNQHAHAFFGMSEEASISRYWTIFYKAFLFYGYFGTPHTTWKKPKKMRSLIEEMI